MVYLSKKSEKNICKFRGQVSREQREALNGHRSAVFWFTGLSGSGKSTIAHAVEKHLHDRGIRSYVFDGDNVRHGLCGDLSFSPVARSENNRRIAEVCKLFADSGTACLCAFISPYAEDRQHVRDIVGEDDFHEIYIACPVETCEERDCKGYYKLAREGKIKNYTGISAPYEEPEAPQLRVNTAGQSVEQSVGVVLEYVLGVLQPTA
ncbi:adenylyl-sulfate kinase [Pseudodesulfovibrio senegalensis]|uniref:Adenylyl-sulfate kinase n=1 Tax=Pseudodesulfovibrio senegalensis TaxID=1721087 RepID=A0A6N6N0R5_9BACT|nr:adenylyl-sulfate kinase [Pseudodesulfovibrio senegalensis]KAB1441429.1 adenylyl-sulfate kinase [Pseudodesulfovibrio senegalensis]